MTNINSAACVAPMNLIALALLATPKQSMLEADLVRQFELYASLLRQAPYSPLVWITETDGASIVRHGERMGVIQRLKHPLGDVMQMTEENSVLMTYFRNNVLHLMALPSLIACCFLNNRTMRTEDIQRLMWRIYPYVRDELFLRWTEDGGGRRGARGARRSRESWPARVGGGGRAVAAAADRFGRGGAAVGARAGHGADHRALLPRDRSAAEVAAAGASARMCSSRNVS